MKKQYLFDKVAELKERFASFFQHRKKITALENFSEAEKFPHRNYLTLVKTCVNEGFLGEEESQFLDHMLRRYEVNYLDWCHKTKWLKQQIAEKKASRPQVVQEFFNFAKPSAQINIPMEVLAAMNQTNQVSARV